MATIALIFFLLTLTLSSTTIHATRESQFFNKLPNKQPQPLNTNQQQPTFIPQSQDSDSYGLYGHESGQLPPSTTTTTNLPDYLPENYNPVAYTTPIHSNTQDTPHDDPQEYHNYNGEMFNNIHQEQFMGTRGAGNMYNSGDTRFSDNDAYNSRFDDARFMETENDGANMYNSDNGRYNSYRQGMNGNTQKQQGMSDTRFLENGKYFYDVDMENLNSNPNMNSRGYRSSYDSRYNTQGYYGNSYDRYDFNGGYRNQEYRFNP